jgi:hypothetical protein
MKLVAARLLGVLGVVGLTFGLAACGGSGAKPTTPQCVLNSDCAKLSPPGLVCALGYCVQACRASSDCPNSERCVLLNSSVGGDASVSVADAGAAVQGTACQAPETVVCQYTSQCKQPLVCGDDHQCRDQCETDVDCPTQQKCTSMTHLCADPTIDKDYDPAINDFVITDGGAGATAGSSGAAGQGGNGGTSGATGGTAGKGAAGHGGTGGASGGGGQAVDAGPPPTGDPCVPGDGGLAPELTINNDPAHASVLPLNTAYPGCIQTPPDLDYYLVSVPSTSMQGGWLTITASGVATGLRIVNALYTAADDTELVFQDAPNPGAGASLYVAGATGTQFLVLIDGVSQNSGSGAYTLTATYRDNPEAGEPNNLRSQATPITVGTPVQGKFFAGYVTGALPTAVDWEDWFSVPLAAGAYTIKLTNVAADIYPNLAFYDPSGVQIGNTFSSTLGADVTLNQTITTAGTYYVVTLPYSTLPTLFGVGTTLPMWGTQSYTLSVATSP